MNTRQDQWSFISIFYEREQWHLLLEALRGEILENPKNAKAVNALVLLSMHRGANIRLVLNYSKSSEHAITSISQTIHSFLSKNPTRDKPPELPITSFFTNFPTNQVRYNLFNHHALMQDGLIVYQEILSTILLQFFEDHPVDEEGLFTLLIYLQKAMLNGMSENADTKKKLCLQLLQVLQHHEYNISAITGDVQIPTLQMRKSSQTRPNELNVQLKDFENASNLLYGMNGNPIKCYIAILKAIQSQLFHIPGKEFFDSLYHIYQSGTNELNSRIEPSIIENFNFT